jgi:hypothetical protein
MCCNGMLCVWLGNVVLRAVWESIYRMAMCSGNSVSVTMSLTLHLCLCVATECCAFGRVMFSACSMGENSLYGGVYRELF